MEGRRVSNTYILIGEGLELLIIKYGEIREIWACSRQMLAGGGMGVGEHVKLKNFGGYVKYLEDTSQNEEERKY